MIIDNEILNQGCIMLEDLEWVRVSKQCHTLVDPDNKIWAVVFTSYDESDGDEFFIWEVKIEEEDFGEYVSLYSAKMAVQEQILEWDEAIARANKRSASHARKKKAEKKVKMEK
jgi:hypothetical protein